MEDIYSSERGFDSQAYFDAQLQALLHRMNSFSGKLYVEVGGKFLHDGHASRVLPGFDPKCKIKLFEAANKAFYRMQSKRSAEMMERDISSEFDDDDVDHALEIILCINAQDIVSRRVWSNDGKSYIDTLWDHLASYKSAGIRRNPLIAINLCSRNPSLNEVNMLNCLTEELSNKGYQSFKRYMISGYPQDTSAVVSASGYGGDDWITVRPGGLTIVTSLGSSCGKLSTCLGQMYLHSQHGITAGQVGYCKFELFPIHNLPLMHPVNLAYEAATADIHDRNMLDPWHLAAYGKDAVNYNRDVEAWPILASLINALTENRMGGGDATGMRKYKSPTDMGVNMAFEGIVNDEKCCLAAMQEIRRRIAEYELLVPMEAPGEESSEEDRKHYAEKVSVVETCRSVLTEAEKYIPSKR